MEYGAVFLALAGLGAFFMAFNNGANDVANSFASAVGAEAISMRQAVLIAGLMNLLGSVLIGGAVSAKLITGVVQPEAFGTPGAFIIAMFSVLIAAGTFVLVSTLFSVPVSSTHSIVGSLIGAGLAAGGAKTVDWAQLTAVVISWFVSPLFAGLLAMALLGFVRRVILGPASKRREIMSRLAYYLPFVLGLVAAVFVMILMKGSALSRYIPAASWEYWLFLLILVPYVILVAQAILRGITKEMPNTEGSAEAIFRRLQVGTSSYVAFAHGANDVANSIAPVFGVFLVVQSSGLPTKELVEQTGVPLWVLILGGAGIATGIGVLGHRVIETLSRKITRLDNFKGFSVDTAAATSVVLASSMGLPVSSTHAATGAIVGTGLLEGKGVDVKVLGKIVVAWLVTVPVAGLLTVGIYFTLRALFG